MVFKLTSLKFVELISSSFRFGKNDKNSANLSVSESELLLANETRLTIFNANPFKTAVFPVIGSDDECLTAKPCYPSHYYPNFHFRTSQHLSFVDQSICKHPWSDQYQHLDSFPCLCHQNWHCCCWWRVLELEHQVMVLIFVSKQIG